MGEVKVSIFIPVYNGEKYLEKCIKSVLSQTLKEIDIYIYNDGSTDSSYEICRHYAALDERIHLSQGKNGTAVSAMNFFIHQSAGECVAFVDQDDYITDNYLEQMYNELIDAGADGAVSSYTFIDANNQTLSWYTPELVTGHTLTGREACQQFLTTLNIEGFRWNKLFRREFFLSNKIEYKQTYLADILAAFDLLMASTKIVMVGTKEYYYRQHSMASVSIIDAAKVLNFLSTYEDIAQIADAYGLRQEGQYYKIWRNIECLFNSLRLRHTNTEEWRRIKRDCSWDKWFELPLAEVFSLLRQYKNPRDSYMKLCIKAVVVWWYFGGML